MTAPNVNYIVCGPVVLTFYLQTLKKGKLSILNTNYFRWGLFTNLFKTCKTCKESVPTSEPQRSHRRVTCWADVTLGAVILEKLFKEYF